MAQVVNAQTNQIKLNSGQVVNAQTGGWYDGQQYWGGSLSAPGVINSQSNQQGAGQEVSKEVVAQTNPDNVAYLAQQNPNLSYANNPNGGGLIDATGQPAPGGGGAGVGFSAPAPLDLPGLYSSLTQSEGINDLEKQLSDKQASYSDAQSKINDNPFLSEATRVGRIAKLTTDYNNDVKNVQDTLAMKQADVKTQLDIAQKQFDINSQSSKQAFDQFQTLLQSGALDNASGQDIANITKATGLSSTMILSAVKAQAEKNVPTSVIQFDDGTNQGYAVINTKTGQVISKQVVAGSKPAKGSGSGSTVKDETAQINLDKKQAPQYATQAAASGWTLGTMMNFFQQYGMSKQQIYSIYNSSNYYKPTAAQKKADQKNYAVK